MLLDSIYYLSLGYTTDHLTISVISKDENSGPLLDFDLKITSLIRHQHS